MTKEFINDEGYDKDMIGSKNTIYAFQINEPLGDLNHTVLSEYAGDAVSMQCHDSKIVVGISLSAELGSTLFEIFLYF